MVYDPTKITYARLLDVFWKNIDPITPNRQFCDIGTQYRSAIYYHNEEQKRLAEASKKALENSGRFQQPIVTEIVAGSSFYRPRSTTRTTTRRTRFALTITSTAADALGDSNSSGASPRDDHHVASAPSLVGRLRLTCTARRGTAVRQPTRRS